MLYVDAATYSSTSSWAQFSIALDTDVVSHRFNDYADCQSIVERHAIRVHQVCDVISTA